jgi:hypothetical protein
MSTIAAIVVAILFVIGSVRPTLAAGECAQPLSSGAQPVATDCLYILAAAVGLQSCDPECICAPKGTLPIAATDALICLGASVGVGVGLQCACPPSLDCEEQEYPCTLDEVSPEVLADSDRIAEGATDMIEAGSSFADAHAWIAAQTGVVEIRSHETAIRFRLSEGRPTWIMSAESLAPFVPKSAAATASAAARTDVAGRAPVVVGKDPDEKHALFLSPFAWSFLPEFLENRPLAVTLENARGYAGNVTNLENVTAEDNTVTVDSFRGWTNYDLVHVVSHGTYICDDTDCRGILIVNERKAPSEPDPARSLQGEVVRLTIPEKLAALERDYIAIGADFFRAQYPSGVGNAIVFLNACRLYSASVTDLAEAIQGTSASVIGWSESVPEDDAFNAAVALYDHLVEGVSLETAVDLIGDLAQPPDVLGLILGVTTQPTGADHRLREIGWLEHPETQASLENEDVVTIPGKVGDGLPDAVPFLVRVDGVDQEPDQFVVHVTIDGVEAPAKQLSAGTQIGEREWRVAGSVGVGRDLEKGEVLSVRAWVELPDQGVSETVRSITVDGDEVTDPWASEYWMGQTTAVLDSPLFGATIVEVTAQVRFDPTGPADPYTGIQHFELTQGTLAWSTSGSVSVSGEDCTYGYGPVEYPLPPGSGYVDINRDASPPTYRGYGEFSGPTIEISTSCADFDFTTRVNPPWFGALDSRPLSSDGTVMAGESVHSRWRFSWNLLRHETVPTP